MSVSYAGIGWNRQKRIYDATLGLALLAAGLLVVGVTLAVNPGTTIETLLIRTSGVLAFGLLHVVLCIGPLARLDARFAPLLYNRRHLGVTMFMLSLFHGAFAIVQFHALGDTNPLVSMLTAYSGDYLPVGHAGASIVHFPFEPLGFLALIILFFMASTSHDYFLKMLGPSVWKSLHLGVYAAYGLLIGHVVLGALQYERSPVYPVVVGAGFVVVLGLHVIAARQEKRADAPRTSAEDDGYIVVCRAADLHDGRGRTVNLRGRRIALFLTGGRIYALSNVCRHQGGPLGEGRILDGCITCPWHGWQYKAGDGASPPPFQEVVPTFRVRVENGIVLVHPDENPLRTECPGADPGHCPVAEISLTHPPAKEIAS